MKLILRRKTKSVLFCATALLAVMTLFYACHKSVGVRSNETISAIENAKTWFTQAVVAPEAKLLALPYSALPKNSDLRTFARMGKISNSLEWENSLQYNSGGLSYIIVPITEDIKPFKNKEFEFFRDVVFYKEESGSMQMSIIEVLSKKGGSLGDNIHLIANTAFKNMYLGRNEALSNITASAIFYGINYVHKSSFQFSNGSWSAAKITIRSDKKSIFIDKPSVLSLSKEPIKKTSLNTMAPMNSCNCQTYYTVGITYDLNTGEILGVDILDESTQCDGPPSGNPGDPVSQDDVDCATQAAADADAMSSGVATATDLESMDEIDLDALRKYKNPKWTCLKNLEWHISSKEEGIVKLINVQNNTWQWESLTHKELSFTGTSHGGTVTFTQGTGTPSFVPGTQNVLYAGMELDFDVTYTPAASSCPGLGTIIPPYTINYQPNALWDAKP